MWKKSEPVLTLELHFSLIHLFLLSVPYAIAIVALLLVSLSLWLQFFCIFAVCMLWFNAYYRSNLSYSSYGIQRLLMNSNGSFSIHTTTHEIIIASLKEISFLHPACTLLVFDCEDDKSRCLKIFPDACNREGFRRLRVRLRWSELQILG